MCSALSNAGAWDSDPQLNFFAGLFLVAQGDDIRRQATGGRARWSLRAHLIVGVAAIVLASVGMMALATRHSANEFLTASYHELARQLAGGAMARADALLSDAAQAVISAHDAIKDGALDVEDQAGVAAFLFDALKRNPHLAGLYFGSPRGDFVYVARMSLASNELFLLKTIRFVGGEKEVSAQLRDRYWRVTQSLLVDLDDFAPTTRPWYRMAMENGGDSWTAPYAFYTSGRQGISFARTLAGPDNMAPGVVGGDIELDEIKRVIAELRVGAKGVAGIAARMAGGDDGADEGSSRWSMLTPTNSPALIAMLAALSNRPGETRPKAVGANGAASIGASLGAAEAYRFAAGGVDYLAVSASFVKTQLPWTLLVAMPEADYLGWFGEAQDFALMIAAIVAALGVGLSLLFWAGLAKPLAQLRAGAAAVSAGQWREVTASDSPFAEISATEAAFASMATALDRQERDNRALTQRLSKLAAAVEQSATAVLIADATGDVEFVNRAFEQLTQHRQQRLLGRSAIGLLVGTAGDATAEEIARRLADGIVWRGERRVPHADGGSFDAMITAAPVRDAEGRVAYGVFVIEDVSSARAHERAITSALDVAVAANQARAQFLAHMSHDLRTPLNAILGFSEIMRGELFGPLGDPRYAEYAIDIWNSGDYLLRIVNQILEIARADSVSLTLNEEAASLTALITATRDLTADQAAARRVSVTVDPPPPAVLRCDPTKLQQALVNLVSNAIKFSQPGGAVRITAAKPAGGGIEIRVIDQGVGMNAQQIDLALQPFMRVNNDPYTRNVDGIGLGLPIAQRLTQLHGGRLSIRSAPGSGATVTVWLPEERLG